MSALKTRPRLKQAFTQKHSIGRATFYFYYHFLARRSKPCFLSFLNIEQHEAILGCHQHFDAKYVNLWLLGFLLQGDVNVLKLQPNKTRSSDINERCADIVIMLLTL